MRIAEPLRRSGLPPMTAVCQSHSSAAAVRPRLSVIVGVFGLPGSLPMKILPCSLTYGLSTISHSLEMPETEVKFATTPTPSRSSSTLPCSRRSVVGTDASLRPFGQMSLAAAAPKSGAARGLLLDGGAARELGDAEDDELGRLHWRDADVDDELARITRLGRVVLLVALDVERLLGGRPEQRTIAPNAQQERVDRSSNATPEPRVVRLEDDPLGALEDRFLDEVEQPADVQVAPGRVARQRPSAPDPDAPAGEGPDAVDPGWVQLVVLGLRDVQLERDRPANDLVRGRLVDAAGVVVAGPDAGQVAARRDVNGLAGERVEDLDPRPVERCVLAVVAGLVDP